ncbi:MAG: hypothetical protein J6S75_01225 [Thermoguttaceae bacterium]|nr:hypothetical protein [Thermoguttaceae bacterium]
MDDIKNQLIGMCKEMMDALAGDQGGHLRGRPPRVFILDFTSADENLAKETYRYENGSLEKVKSGTKNKKEPISGMFFAEGYFAVSIYEHAGFATMSYQIGPLYGRGYRYKIVTGKNGNTLGKPKLDWVS